MPKAIATLLNVYSLSRENSCYGPTPMHRLMNYIFTLIIGPKLKDWFLNLYGSYEQLKKTRFDHCQDYIHILFKVIAQSTRYHPERIQCSLVEVREVCIKLAAGVEGLNMEETWVEWYMHQRWYPERDIGLQSLSCTIWILRFGFLQCFRVH